VRRAKTDSNRQYLSKLRKEGRSDPELRLGAHKEKCYQIGDTGPGGGIIFSIPFTGHNNTANIYYEVGPNDLSMNNSPYDYFRTPPSCEALTETGAEFGSYSLPLSPAFTSSSYHMNHGHHNTDILDLIPITAGAHPYTSGHHIAATLCKNYTGPNWHTDWFLPSAEEALDLITNIGINSPFANIANLLTSLSNPASAFYWTSSVPILLPAGTTPHTTAVGFVHSASVSQLLDLPRCTTASVRPIRRFTCTPEVLLDPVLTPVGVDPVHIPVGVDPTLLDPVLTPVGTTPTTTGISDPVLSDPVLTPYEAPGVAYNYRFHPDARSSGTVRPSWQGSFGPSPIHPSYDYIIGDPNYKLMLQIANEDVAGNVYSQGDFGVVPPFNISWYRISVWDIRERFRGSWRYDLNPADQIPPGTPPQWLPGTPSTGLASLGSSCLTAVVLSNPIHLAGPDPILDMTNATKFPMVPECLGCYNGPYPVGTLPSTIPPTPGTTGWWPGVYCATNTNPNPCNLHPHASHIPPGKNSFAYVRIEQTYMLQNPYGNTQNLTNYAGTGRNLRFIGTNTEWASDDKDFLYYCQNCNHTGIGSGSLGWSCDPWLKESPPPPSIVTGFDPYCQHTPGMPCRNHLLTTP